MLLGTAAQTFVLVYITWKTDWDKQVNTMITCNSRLEFTLIFMLQCSLFLFVFLVHWRFELKYSTHTPMSLNRAKMAQHNNYHTVSWWQFS